MSGDRRARFSRRSLLAPHAIDGGGTDGAVSALARELAEVRATVEDLDDLTEGNPTKIGLDALRGATSALADERADRYAPEPFGLRSARAAIAAYYAAHGATVDPSRVVIGASTSELYGWLFKLLVDPGDEVLVPRPSYPLLDWLAALEGVELVGCRTRRDEGFRLDPDEVARALHERTRAIAVVHPNNPTGRFVREDDARALVALAASRDVALVVDEVFADWPSREADPDRRRTFAGETAAPVFVLSGLSKVACLPQLKLAWMVVGGPPSFAEAALARLELIADTYLSVGTPVQVALPALLAGRATVHAELGARLERNLAALDEAISRAGLEAPVRRMRLEGGWYAMLEVARTRTDEAWVTHLAREARAIVQPGYFFDAEEEGLLVVSLLPEPARFAAAIERVVRCLAAG